MRIIVTVLTLIFITVLTSISESLARKIGMPPYMCFWGSLILWFVLTTTFVYKAIRKISADPPYKGVLLFLGRRQKKVLREGWNFLPLYPIVFDVVLINMTSVNQDLPEQDVRTPDGTSLGIKISITWTPGASLVDGSKEAETLISFLNKGRKEGVMNILQDIIGDRLRMWAFSKEEGPANWQEAMGAKDEAIAVLIKAVLGDDIPSIPSSVPTSVLLKYFSTPPKKPLQYEKRWGRKNKDGNDWEGLEEELAKLTPQELDTLKERIEERQDIITKARQGNGAFVKKSLGITINRFTIPSIILKGEVAKAADLQAKEVLERAAERTELSHVRARTKELKKALDIKSEPALEVVQTERGKVKKDVHESKISISSETQEAVKGIVSLVLQALKKP